MEHLNSIMKIMLLISLILFILTGLSVLGLFVSDEYYELFSKLVKCFGLLFMITIMVNGLDMVSGG